MSEELVPQESIEVEIPQAEPAEAQESALSEQDAIEQEARAKGWKPDGGEKSAAEFLRSEPLYKEISASHKKIKELKEVVDKLSQHMTAQQELGYKKAMKELERARVEAIQMGDVETVNNIDKEIREHTSPESERHNSQEAKAFFDRHSSWMNDPSYEAQKMREFVERRDKEVARFNLPMAEHVKIIERDLAREFPDRFKQERQIEEPAHNTVVESQAAKPAAVKRFSVRDLAPEEQQVFNYLNRNAPPKGMTEAAKNYMKQVFEARGTSE